MELTTVFVIRNILRCKLCKNLDMSCVSHRVADCSFLVDARLKILTVISGWLHPLIIFPLLVSDISHRITNCSFPLDAHFLITLKSTVNRALITMRNEVTVD